MQVSETVSTGKRGVGEPPWNMGELVYLGFFKKSNSENGLDLSKMLVHYMGGLWIGYYL
jgi:hypothetical protein